MSQTYLGLVATILLILGIILLLAGYIINRGKPEEKKDARITKLGVISLVLAVLLIIIYIATPFVISALGIELPPPECLN